MGSGPECSGRADVATGAAASLRKRSGSAYYQATPWAIIALATLMKPATLAPLT